jgi:hypothetical protein
LVGKQASATHLLAPAPQLLQLGLLGRLVGGQLGGLPLQRPVAVLERGALGRQLAQAPLQALDGAGADDQPACGRAA